MSNEQEKPKAEFQAPQDPGSSLRRSSRSAASKPKNYRFKTKADFARHSSSDIDTVGIRQWHVKEKERLLNAVQKFGSKDQETLAKAVQTRSEEEVQGYIRRLKEGQNVKASFVRKEPSPHVLSQDQKAKKVTAKRSFDAAIEKWIRLIELEGHKMLAFPQGQPDASDVVRIAVEGIAKLETHPEMESRESVDYGSIYQCIGNLMAGETPKNLNTASSQKLLDVLARLYDEKKTMVENIKHKTSLVESYVIPKLPRTEEECKGSLANVNTLRLPSNLFLGD